MHEIFVAFGRALWSQLHVRMLLLTFMPFLLSVAIWGVVLWFGLQPLIDWVQNYFAENDGFRVTGSVLGAVGLGALKAVIVPLIAMWLLLPLMILTTLIFIGVLAMPAIVSHTSNRYYPRLEKRNGGSIWGSIWIALSTFSVFAVLWIATLPLSAILPLGFVIHAALWGWLTYRVITYDALSVHADVQERKTIMHRHRWPLLFMGTVAGACGTVPTLLWLGGVLSVIFLPVLAALSIWFYVLVFTFSGLWFQHYCLAALNEERSKS